MGARRSTPLGEVWLEVEVIVHVFNQTTVNEAGARDHFETASELAADPMPAVVDLRGVGYLDAGTRALITSDAGANSVATALVIDNLSSRAMADTMVRVNRPRRPMETFTSLVAATEWARAFAGNGEHG